jgi:hypothetical protein
VLDSPVALEGNGGCAQGGVNLATVLYGGGGDCGIAPGGLTAPFLVRFLPVIAVIWCF